MAKGTGFGKTILIGDQFVLDEVPAIVSSIPFVTETTVERIDGEGWVLQDDRIEVPGYKAKKAEQQGQSIDRILDVMGIDAKKTPSRSPSQAPCWPAAAWGRAPPSACRWRAP